MTEDLGIKVDTPTGMKWLEVLAAQEASIINNEVNKEIAEMIVEMAKKKIAEEKEKLK
jgi:hypothetical protein